MSARRQAILDLVAANREGAQAKGRSAGQVKAWQRAVESAVEGCRADFPMFGKKNRDRMQIFDSHQLVAYEWRRGGKDWRTAFLLFVVKGIAFRQLNEIPRLRLIFITDDGTRDRIERDSLANMLRHMARTDGVESEVLAEERLAVAASA